MRAKGLKIFVVLALLAGRAKTQEFTLHVLEEGKSTSIRGLSVPNDSVAWVSGSDGWVGQEAAFHPTRMGRHPAHQ